MIEKEDMEYPNGLKILKRPPERLYCLGDISLLSNRMVAVVGSRKTSAYGRWAATSISKRLSQENITVVSGMARGIDTNAHKGALEHVGKTIAVLGMGIDGCYPAENWRLKDIIANRGLVISEYPPGVKAQKWTFPQRNRIIAGLTEMVVIAEAGLNSGAFITAEIAMEQSKQVMAVPGNINNPYNIGNNKLIVDGATPVVVIEDIVEAMGIYGRKNKTVNIELGVDEKKIISILDKGGEMTVDEISRRLSKTSAEVNGIITILEMKGVIQTSVGKIFVAK